MATVRKTNEKNSLNWSMIKVQNTIKQKLKILMCVHTV